jgi:hypothetical protein
LALVSVLVNIRDTSFNSHFCFCNYYFMFQSSALDSVFISANDQKLLLWKTWGHWNNSYITKVMCQICWPMRNKRFADIYKKKKWKPFKHFVKKNLKLGLNLIFFFMCTLQYILRLLFWLVLLCKIIQSRYIIYWLWKMEWPVYLLGLMDDSGYVSTDHGEWLLSYSIQSYKSFFMKTIYIPDKLCKYINIASLLP